MKGFMLPAFALFFLALASCDWEGFNGKPQDVGLTTVGAAHSIPNNSRLSLQGSLTSQVGSEYYWFSDGTGEILVEIEWKVWNMAALQWGNLLPSEKVEISGKLERERNTFKMEVKTIRKLPPPNKPDETDNSAEGE
ncbi:MAG: NirD/YgiW/YdeI family stress tolerance protein [Treponema sp.]|nr:NirD/YgiW/YdeI family stress tolerance protein [Treponema sp.]